MATPPGQLPRFSGSRPRPAAAPAAPAAPGPSQNAATGDAPGPSKGGDDPGPAIAPQRHRAATSRGGRVPGPALASGRAPRRPRPDFQFCRFSGFQVRAPALPAGQTVDRRQNRRMPLRAAS